MAGEMNAEYWAVSAKTGYNIDKLFCRIAALAFNESILNENETYKQVEIGTELICKNMRRPYNEYSS